MKRKELFHRRNICLFAVIAVIVVSLILSFTISDAEPVKEDTLVVEDFKECCQNSLGEKCVIFNEHPCERCDDFCSR